MIYRELSFPLLPVLDLKPNIKLDTWTLFSIQKKGKKSLEIQKAKNDS